MNMNLRRCLSAAVSIFLAGAVLGLWSAVASAQEYDWESPGKKEGDAIEKAIEQEDVDSLKSFLEQDLDVDGFIPPVIRKDFEFTAREPSLRANRMMTPLGLAMEWQKPAAAKFLLEANADFDAMSVMMERDREAEWEARKSFYDHGPKEEFTTLGDDLYSPLMHAAISSFTEGVTMLLERGADADAVGAHGVTALMAASAAGNADIVKVLLDKQVSVDERLEEPAVWGPLDRIDGTDGATAIWLAARAGHEEVAILLMRAGANTETRALCERTIGPRGEEECSPAEIAERNGHGKISEILRSEVAHPAPDIPEIDWRREIREGGQGLHALMSDLVARGDLETLQMYLDDGYDVDAYFIVGEGPLRQKQVTLLLVAAERQAPKVVQFLLQKGADPDKMSRHAGMEWSESINGADPDAGLDSPLMLAARSECLPCVALLLRAGADVDAASPPNETALAIAAIKGNAKMVKMLLSASAEVDPVIQVLSESHASLMEGSTPLWYAAWKGHAETVRHLLEAGADSSVETHCSLMRNSICTPRAIAATWSRRDTLLVFDEHGVTE